jgi:hypothetical protein
MIVKVRSHRKGAIRYIFDNGNEVSIIFGAGTYSDLNDSDWETRTDSTQIESTTVEIMVDGSKKFIKWFEKNYEYNPAACIEAKEIPKILKKADSKVYKKETQNA